MTAHASFPDDYRPTIAIVGGGFSGAALAYHLAIRQAPARIVVFEPRARLGGGLAYDTDEPTNRINVPADRMSLIPGDEGHFARWIEASGQSGDDPDAMFDDGRLFPRRSLFGAYAAAHVEPLVTDGRIEHIRQRVKSIRREGNAWWIGGEGTGLWASHVVIATTHPPPTPPQALAGLAGDERVVFDPLISGWADAIGGNDRVLVVGTGLTMADTIAALDRRGHRGPILAISRRGLRSRSHGDATSPYGDFISTPASTALGLLTQIRMRLRAAAAEGVSWHAVLDAVRAQASPIWANLPEPEQRRVVQRLRPFWDVHRFRIAPAVNAVLDRRIEEDRLEIRAAHLHSVEADVGAITVVLRRSRSASLQREIFDRVIVTTGPGHADILRHQPALAGLHEAGLLRLDRVGLGLDCDRRARAIGHDGLPVPGLFVTGPLARGTFGELMGLSQVSVFALFLSELLLETLSIEASA